MPLCQMTDVRQGHDWLEGHGFRHASATTITEEKDHSGDGTHVLGHKDKPTVTLYSMTTEGGLEAGRALTRII